MGQFFGTDGIRGVAGRFPLTSTGVTLLGLAAGKILHRHVKQKNLRVLIVRDTRQSGMSLANALSNGLRKKGIDVYDAGVLCTPAVAHLVRSHRFDSGVVISASHNPPAFNGIKFFTPHGRKWPDVWELDVEKEFLRLKKQSSSRKKTKSPSGQWINAASLAQDYENFLIQTLPSKTSFKGLRLAMDCSHGANYSVGPQLLRDLGAKVFVIGNKPTGNNINVGCGSQNTKKLGHLVRKKRCHCGIAFDGDGDRVMFVDEKGRLMDGDYLIALLAKSLKGKRKLNRSLTVITVMANLGLKLALKKLKIKTIETPVGDRYVSESMKQHRAILGGEQSGHIILGQHLPSGDGLLTALHVLEILRERKKAFSKLVSWMKKYPQVLVNVPVKEKRPVNELNGVHKKILKIEKVLGSRGRILVRYSGTEPLLRIMIEGQNKNIIQQFANELVHEVQSALR